MITVKIKGKEVQAALLNPNVIKRYEDGFAETLRRFGSAQEIEPASEAIRQQCQAVIDYVKDIFGAQGAKEIFGEETDLLECMDILEEMQELYEKQVNPLVEEKTERLKRKIAGAE